MKIPIFILTCLGGALAVQSAEKDSPITIPLAHQYNGWSTYRSIEDSGFIEPFNNDAGKLAYAVDSQTLWLDVKGNGTLTDSFTARRQFEWLTPTVNTKSGKYKLRVYIREPGKGLITSATELTGKFGSLYVSISDMNINGVFNDEYDRITFKKSKDFTSSRRISDREISCSNGQTISSGGKLMTAQITEETLTLTPYTGKTAKVTLTFENPAWQTTAFFGTDRNQSNCLGKQVKRPLSLVPDTYFFTANVDSENEKYAVYSTRPQLLTEGSHHITIVPPNEIKAMLTLKDETLTLRTLALVNTNGDHFNAQKMDYTFEIILNGKVMSSQKPEYG